MCWKLNNKVNFLVTFTLPLLLSLIKSIDSQTFFRSCMDPLVLMHVPLQGHTYCSHACRGAADGVMDSCQANGDCLCTLPCSDDPAVLAMPATLGSDICPPYATDIPDTDATALPACMGRCNMMCGGVAMICGETNQPDNTAVKVCTCSCPPKPCAVVTTTQAPVPVPMPNPTIITTTVVRKKKRNGRQQLLTLLLNNLPLISQFLLKLLSLFFLKCLVAHLLYSHYHKDDDHYDNDDNEEYY